MEFYKIPFDKIKLRCIIRDVSRFSCIRYGSGAAAMDEWEFQRLEPLVHEVGCHGFG